jgi:hypothetical protein
MIPDAIPKRAMVDVATGLRDRAGFISASNAPRGCRSESVTWRSC